MTTNSPDYDRCGWGTPWGCKQFIPFGEDTSLVLNAAEPEDSLDNGHRLFHSACLPAEAQPSDIGRSLLAATSSNGASRRKRNRALRAV